MIAWRLIAHKLQNFDKGYDSDRKIQQKNGRMKGKKVAEKNLRVNRRGKVCKEEKTEEKEEKEEKEKKQGGEEIGEK